MARPEDREARQREQQELVPRSKSLEVGRLLHSIRGPFPVARWVPPPRRPRATQASFVEAGPGEAALLSLALPTNPVAVFLDGYVQGFPKSCNNCS